MTEQEKKSHTIVVNGRRRQWDEDDISFEQLVALAFPTPAPGGNVEYTISYRRAHGHKPEGTLKADDSRRGRPTIESLGRRPDLSPAHPYLVFS